jgi:hypothetical protein
MKIEKWMDIPMLIEGTSQSDTDRLVKIKQTD